MVQSVLIFALGFLAAAFIALAVGPAVWRRAADLTRKRIEASLPLTLNELQADKDQLRAEFAISLSKANAKAKKLQDKIAAQMADVGSNREMARVLTDERDALNVKATELQGALAEALSALSARKADINDLIARGMQLETQLDELSGTVHERENAIRNLNIDLDNKRIELAAGMTEQEQLRGKINDLIANRRALEAKLRDVARDFRAALEAQRTGERRVAVSEKRAEKLATQFADREERLMRREAELAKLKDDFRILNTARSKMDQMVQTLERQKQTLEKQIMRLEDRLQNLPQVKDPSMLERSVKKLEGDKARLLNMVQQLTREKNELVARLQAANNTTGDSTLRDKVQEIAAKVVAITVEKEGQGSPVAKLLNKANESSAPSTENEGHGSLANRIRAVQNAARRGN